MLVEDTFHHRPHTQEGSGKKSQVTETEMPLDGLVDDEGIRGVVADAAQQGMSSAPCSAAEGEVGPEAGPEARLEARLESRPEEEAGDRG